LIILSGLAVAFCGVHVALAQDADATVVEADGEDNASPAIQRIKLKDGREIEGKVSRTESGDVRIEAKYGVLTFKAEDVASIVEVVAPRDAYMERKSRIDTNDADALYDLARWVLADHGNDRDLLENAQADLRKALKIKEDHKRAELLLRLVDAKLASFAGEASGETATATAEGPGKFAEDELVSQRDIYSIRMAELRESDRVTIKYENDVLNRFIELMRQAERTGWDQRNTELAFRGLSRQRQVTYMLEQEPNNWNLQKDILITTDPAFMQDFRRKVWPIIRRTAASMKNGYGANLMDGYKFKISASGGDPVDYTNFVILVGYKKGRVRMVDRQKPEDSLILKAGLQETIDPSVDPRTVMPSYTIINSTEYKVVLEWIKSLRGPMEPNYHLEWQPPQGVVIDTDGKPDMPGLGDE
jgi:hypothetical protein